MYKIAARNSVKSENYLVFPIKPKDEIEYSQPDLRTRLRPPKYSKATLGIVRESIVTHIPDSDHGSQVIVWSWRHKTTLRAATPLEKSSMTKPDS